MEVSPPVTQPPSAVAAWRDRATTLDLARECLRRQGLVKVAELVWEGVMASEARLDSHDQQLLLDLGLACHRQMLAEAAADPDQAIDLACWGTRLFGHLLDHASPQAEWVAIHHEQFCRYGSIWIHGRLKAPDAGPSSRERRDLHVMALQMLERLETYHTPLPDWVPELRRELLAMESAAVPAALAATPGGEPLIAIVGNCQSHPLFLGLERALPSHRFHFCTPVHLASKEEVAELHRVLRHTHLLVMHRITPGYRDGIGLDGATLEALLPAGARAVVLPNLHYEGYHPTIGYAHDDRGQLPALAAESPLGDYHDFLAMAAAEQGLEAAALLALPANAAMEELLRGWHRRSLQELARREQDCDLCLSRWLEANYNAPDHPLPLFHTFNHPSNQLLERLLGDLIRLLELPASVEPATIPGTVESLGRQRHGILPWTRQALALPAWASGDGRSDWEKAWRLEEQLNASIAFYRRHDWLVACNRQQEKFHLAEDLLRLALSGD
ncbi:MAG: hypothetical protein ER33_05225 [Cyanobium sp. CACIAM 14]|nr:MAG: hypothetical protein ER33_05225 [Cyanobium sp. CACIAM 14]